MRIKRLSETLVNRIAAGEVIERPSSVVKELVGIDTHAAVGPQLVENALDAGAGAVEIVIEQGGRTLVRVTDDGYGMTPDELEVAVERHATSKLTDETLFDIRTLGFRGEALPSIGAVSRLTIASRPQGTASAFEIAIDGGRVAEPRPVALSGGTRIEVRDLFFATPARQ